MNSRLALLSRESRPTLYWPHNVLGWQFFRATTCTYMRMLVSKAYTPGHAHSGVQAHDIRRSRSDCDGCTETLCFIVPPPLLPWLTPGPGIF
jgi:hypothetical protein